MRVENDKYSNLYRLKHVCCYLRVVGAEGAQENIAIIYAWQFYARKCFYWFPYLLVLNMWHFTFSALYNEVPTALHSQRFYLNNHLINSKLKISLPRLGCQEVQNMFVWVNWCSSRFYERMAFLNIAKKVHLIRDPKWPVYLQSADFFLFSNN